MFDKDLLSDTVAIRTRDGKVYTDVRASVQKGKILTDRTDVPIQPGDEVVRRLPSGIDEVFVVDDPDYQSGFGGIPPFYNMRVHRADAPAREARASTVTYNVTGQNARFNINSVDASTNVVNRTPGELFEALRRALQEGIPAGLAQQELLGAAKELEREMGKPSFLDCYSRFIALAANHVQIVAPFIPALTQMLRG